MTGDQVTVLAPGVITFQPGKGREHIPFLTEQIGDDQYVFPSDVLPLLADGSLDERLFNVNRLHEFGYGQHRSDPLRTVTHAPAVGDAGQWGGTVGAEESYDLTLAHTDLDGVMTSNYETSIIGPLNSSDRIRITQDDPEVTVRVPVGDYLLYSWVLTLDAQGKEIWTMLLHPQLSVTEDQTVELDARLAEPVTVTMPDPSAELVHLSALAQYKIEQGPTMSITTHAVEEGGLYLAQLGPDQPTSNLTTAIRGTWAVPGQDGRVESARELYHLADFIDGRFPTGYERELHPDELAQLESDFAVQVDGGRLGKAAISIRPDPFVGGSTPYLPLDGPITRTEYYTTGGGVEWRSNVLEEIVDQPTSELIIQLSGEPITFDDRQPPAEEWNYGVFGPGFSTESAGVGRTGNRLAIAPDLYGDRAGHSGSVAASGRVSVWRDGELIAERLYLPSLTSMVNVGPEPAEYRVEVEAQRSGSSPFASATSVAWTFHSEYTGEDTARLPVPVVRFTPDLDGTNTARTGRPFFGRADAPQGLFLVPVEVQTAPGSAATEVADLTVEVSFDDGLTWEAAPVVGGTGGQQVQVVHPTGDGFASLRASVTDQAGNTVEQTILHAYAFSDQD